MNGNRKPVVRIAALILGSLMLFGIGGMVIAQSNSKNVKYEASMFKGLEYRNIGPFRGGRSTACAGVPSQPNVFYFGATGGGVWKTIDGGASWDPISDADFKTGSVGAIAVADSDPNVLYVGMGESPIRGNVSHGDGVYKSMDAGKTWKNVGLQDTRQISRVRIHPKTLTWSTWPRSVTSGDQTTIGVCFDQKMAARPGKRFYSKITKQARLT